MRILSFILAATWASTIFPSSRADDQSATRPRRVLLLAQKSDGHPAATHEYMAGVRLLAHLLSQQPGVRTIVVQADSPWPDGPELLDSADGVVLFLSEGAKWLSEDQLRLSAFQRLAERGGGLACLHWAMGTRDAGPIAEFTKLFGACHGGPDRKYKVVSVTACPAPGKHEILTGIIPFGVHDEFYYSLKKPLDNHVRSVTPLLLVPIDGKDEMVAWACERTGTGRSFGFSGLHFHSNWKLPEYRRLILHGIAWTIRIPIPNEGLPVDLPDELLNLPEATIPR